MAKSQRGAESIGGAWFEIGGDNSGLKDALTDSVRSTAQMVGQITRLGGRGLGALGGIGAGAAAVGAGAATAAAFAGKAAVDFEGGRERFAREVGRAGGTDADRRRMLDDITQSIQGLPISQGEVLPYVSKALFQGAIAPGDQEGLQKFLKLGIGAGFTTGTGGEDLKGGFEAAMAANLGDVSGLRQRFRGISADPTQLQASIDTAMGQAQSNIDTELSLGQGLSRRTVRNAFNRMQDGFSMFADDFSEGMSRFVTGAPSYADIIDIQSEGETRATGMTGSQRQRALGYDRFGSSSAAARERATTIQDKIQRENAEQFLRNNTPNLIGSPVQSNPETRDTETVWREIARGIDRLVDLMSDQASSTPPTNPEPGVDPQ